MLGLHPVVNGSAVLMRSMTRHCTHVSRNIHLAGKVNDALKLCKLAAAHSPNVTQVTLSSVLDSIDSLQYKRHNMHEHHAAETKHERGNNTNTPQHTTTQHHNTTTPQNNIPTPQHKTKPTAHHHYLQTSVPPCHHTGLPVRRPIPDEQEKKYKNTKPVLRKTSSWRFDAAMQRGADQTEKRLSGTQPCR